MKLENTFVVAASPDDVWPVLIDLERVGRCIPGASLAPAGDGGFRGRMRVKLGPVTTSYEGAVRLLDVDRDERTASIEVVAQETDGNGSASALIVSTVTPEGPASTRVESTTDLKIVGRVAQLGRGAIEDVSAALLDDFGARLGREIASSPAAAPFTDGASPPTREEALDASAVLRRTVRRKAAALGVAAACIAVAAVARSTAGRRRRRLSVRIDLAL